MDLLKFDETWKKNLAVNMKILQYKAIMIWNETQELQNLSDFDKWIIFIHMTRYSNYRSAQIGIKQVFVYKKFSHSTLASKHCAHNVQRERA